MNLTNSPRNHLKNAHNPLSLTLAIGVFFFCIYSCSIGTPFYSSDGQVMYETARALALEQTLAIPPSDLPQTLIGHDGHTYSKYDPGLPLLSIPLVIATDELGKATKSDRYALGAIAVQLIPALAMSIAIAGLYHIAAQIYAHRRALTVTLIAGFCTLAWPYARLYFAEAVVAGFLTIAAACLIRPHPPTPSPNWRGGVSLNYLVATLALGVAILTRASAIIYLPAFVFLIWQKSLPEQRLRNLVILGIGPLVALGGLALHNYLRFHGLMTTGYEKESFNRLPFEGIIGLLFSPGKSIFLYAPPLILSVIFWRRLRKSQPTLAWALVILASSALAFYGAWWAWHGGWVWGPRFLVPLVPLWCLPLGEIPLKRGWVSIVLVVCVIGFGVQILGTFTDVTPHYAKIFTGDPDDERHYAMVHYAPAKSPLVGAFERAQAGQWESPALFELNSTGLPGDWVDGIRISIGGFWVGSTLFLLVSVTQKEKLHHERHLA